MVGIMADNDKDKDCDETLIKKIIMVNKVTKIMIGTRITIMIKVFKR